MLKLLTLIVLLSTFDTHAFADDNLKRHLELYHCSHEVFQLTYTTLPFSMVMEYCEQEKKSDLLKAANLWNSVKNIGFEEALRRVKAQSQK